MYETTDDINRCKRILQDILRDRDISLEDNIVDEVVKKVIALAYATGGSYTDQSLEEYTKVYLNDVSFLGLMQNLNRIR